MELESTGASEVQESSTSSTPAESATPAASTGLDSLKAATPVANDALQTAPEPVQNQWVPNYKFKIGGVETEIEEWLKPIIKNKEIEDKVRDLYTKANGLENLKPRYQTLKDDFDNLRTKSSQVESALEALGGFVRENDFDSFFDGLNIPKNKVLEYALELVRREQMTPEQKSQWEAGRQAREAARYYEAQNQQLLESQQQFAVQRRTFELDNVLNTPDAKVVSEAYNAGMGSPDAFRNYCIQIGQAYAARGEDISAQQAVSEAVRHLRAMNSAIGSTQNANLAPVVQPSQKPVIPNIQGRGTSAVKSTVKSLDDLKRRAKELQEQY